MATYKRPTAGRLALGVFLNVLLGFVAIQWVSGQLMKIAGGFLGQEVAWPQVSFMSSYPDDVRNGYFVFVFSVYLVVYLFSGVIGGLIGASPGKYLLGIRYVTCHAHGRLFYQMTLRAGLICMLLLPIFLLGPILGFVFGRPADPISLLSLCFGIYLWIIMTSSNEQSESWLDASAGVLPILIAKT